VEGDMSQARATLAVLAATLEVKTKNFSNLAHGPVASWRDHPRLVLQPPRDLDRMSGILIECSES